MNKPLSKDMWVIFKDLRDVAVVMCNEFSDSRDKDQREYAKIVEPIIKKAESILMPRKM